MINCGSWSGLTYEMETNKEPTLDPTRIPCKSSCSVNQSLDYFQSFFLLIPILGSIIWNQYHIITTKKKLDKLKTKITENDLVENVNRTDRSSKSTISKCLQKLDITLNELAEKISELKINYGKDISKLKTAFPTFSGIQEPGEWLNRAAMFLNYNNTVEDQRVTVASYYLEGEAYQWIQWLQNTYKKDGSEMTWEIFKRELLSRFGPTEYEDYGESLSRVRQMGSLRDYRKEFERLSNRVGDWKQKELIGTFVGGLKEEIAEDVKLSNPRSLRETIETARVSDEKLSKERTASSRSNYSSSE